MKRKTTYLDAASIEPLSPVDIDTRVPDAVDLLPDKLPRERRREALAQVIDVENHWVAFGGHNACGSVGGDVLQESLFSVACDCLSLADDGVLLRLSHFEGSTDSR